MWLNLIGPPYAVSRLSSSLPSSRRSRALAAAVAAIHASPALR